MLPSQARLSPPPPPPLLSYICPVLTPRLRLWRPSVVAESSTVRSLRKHNDLQSPREPESPAPSMKLVMPSLQRLAVLPRSPMDHKMVDNDLAVSPSARMLFSAAQDENALACGSNDEGQLGVGPTAGDSSAEPQQLVGPLRWVALSQGGQPQRGRG